MKDDKTLSYVQHNVDLAHMEGEQRGGWVSFVLRSFFFVKTVFEKVLRQGCEDVCRCGGGVC